MQRPIDREKVIAECRKLSGADLMILLNRAMMVLPEDTLICIIRDYIRVQDIVAAEGDRVELLETIRRFHDDSLRDVYLDQLDVNRRSFMDHSRGTERFIAEHTRLVDACVVAERDGDSETARQGLELLMDLARRLDNGDDFVFFADEGGSWQVRTEWKEPILAWIRSLSVSPEPCAWARSIMDSSKKLGHLDRAAIRREAELATSETQRWALWELADEIEGWRLE